MIEGTDIVIPRRGRDRGRMPAPADRRRPRSAPTWCAQATRSLTSPRAPAWPRAPWAAMNGLDPAEPLLIGTVLKRCPRGPPWSPRPRRRSRHRARRRALPDVGGGERGDDRPDRVRPRRARLAGGRHRLAGERLRATLVSAANARGVMQILPGTWTLGATATSPRGPSTRARRSTTCGPACCTSRSCCATPAGTGPRRGLLLPGARLGAERGRAARDAALRGRRARPAGALRRPSVSTPHGRPAADDLRVGRRPRRLRALAQRLLRPRRGGRPARAGVRGLGDREHREHVTTWW